MLVPCDKSEPGRLHLVKLTLFPAWLCLQWCTCAAAANDTMAAAQQVVAALLGGGTNVVLLENMLNAATIRSADERQEVRRAPCSHAQHGFHASQCQH
jgi:hypothetical protein